MSIFTVRTYLDGKVQGTRDIDAEEAHQAAEMACQTSLSNRGDLRQLRAMVWQIRVAGAERLTFYQRDAG
jgi:hypothetical protein